MTRLFMGHKAGVGAVLKVMANDTDNPLTTPNTDHAKFRFNSETGMISYIYDTALFVWDSIAYPPTGTSNANSYPIDGSASTCTRFALTHWENAAPQGTYYTISYCINHSRLFSDNVPRITEIRYRNVNGQFIKASDAYWEDFVWESSNYYWWGNFVYEHVSGFVNKTASRNFGIYANGTNGPWSIGDYVVAATFNNSPNPNGSDYNTKSFWGVEDPSIATSSSLSALACKENKSIKHTDTAVIAIWDLPANNNPLPSNGVYAAGKKMAVLTPSVVKIARSGYDIDTATYDQLILSSEKVPAKIIKCGEVTIAANSSSFVEIDGAFPLTGTIYVDYLIKFVGGNLFVPFQREDTSSWNSSEIYINYKIDLSGNRVELINPRPVSVVVRYMVIGDDDLPQSTGGGKVLETGAGFQRIYRPGANSTNPSWSDILLDTRLSYLPIISEGYVSSASMGVNSVQVNHRGLKSSVISFDNGGLKPFLKYSIVSSSGHCYPPHHRKIITSEPHLSVGRESALALLTDDNVTFYANPNGWSHLSRVAGNWVGDAAGLTMAGIRYYILGLPI